MILTLHIAFGAEDALPLRTGHSRALIHPGPPALPWRTEEETHSGRSATGQVSAGLPGVGRGASGSASNAGKFRSEEELCWQESTSQNIMLPFGEFSKSAPVPEIKGNL